MILQNLLAVVRRRDWHLGAKPGPLRAFTLRWSKMFSKENQGLPFLIGKQTHFVCQTGQLMMGWDTKPSSFHAHGWELAVPALFLVKRIKKETELQLWVM